MTKKQILSISSVQYVSMGVNFSSQFILTYYLTLEVFGTFAKLVAIKEVLIAYMSLNLGMSIIYNKTQKQSDLLTTAIYLGIGQVFLYLVGGSIVLYVMYLLKIVDQHEALLLMLLIFSGSAMVFYRIIFSLFEKNERFIFNSVILAIVMVISSSISIVTAIYFPTSLVSLMIKEMLPAFLLMFLYVGFAYKEFNKEAFKFKFFDKNIAMDLIGYSSKMYLSRLTEALYYRLDILLVSYFFTKEVSGLYERTKYFSSIAMLLVTSFVNRINFVKYSKSFDIKYFNSTDFYALIVNISLYFLILSIIYILAFFKHTSNWNDIISLFPFMFGFAIGSLVENLKTMLYAKGEVVLAMKFTRILPIIIFLVMSFFVFLLFGLREEYIAFSYSVSFIFPLLLKQKLMRSYERNSQNE